MSLFHEMFERGMLYVTVKLSFIRAKPSIRLFADDTSLYIIVENPITSAVCLNSDLSKISIWANNWLVDVNPIKTESMLISRKLNKPVHPPLFMQEVQIAEVSSHKHLGLVLSNDCTWHQHIDYITKKAWNMINIMQKLKFKLDRSSLEIIFTTFIRPLPEYGDIVWDNCTQFEKQEIEKIQIEAARIATGTTKLVSLNALYQETGRVRLEKRRENHKLVMFYKMYNDLTPSYLSSLVPQLINNLSQYSLRNADNLQSIHARTNLYFQSFLPSVVRKWNDLSDEAKRPSSVTSFKNFSNGICLFQNISIQAIGKHRSCIHVSEQNLYSRNITESPFCRCG